MANYLDRLAELRSQRVRRRAGKALIHEEPEMLGLIGANKVPTMIQHCVLKVMKKMPGNDKERFLSAFNICSATFSKYGFTRRGTMGMTGKGVKRNRRHQREKEASSKKTRYNNTVDRLWKSAIKRQEEAQKNAKKTTNAQSRMDRLKAQRAART